MNKYADNFCESVKIITESLLEGLKFDQTVECTIVDDSKADVGVYRVSNGSTTFTAYSQEKYTKGTAVFVTIPNGDYNKDKLITGKKATTLADNVLVYYTPFDNLLDVTGNLIDTNTSKGLIANHSTVEAEIFDTQVLNNGQDLNGGRGYADFTRLGIRANFKTLLKDLNCQSGNYGLHLEITFKNYTGEGKEKLTTRDCYLQVEDMIGNPYNFETYFSQEKVFDITSLGLVTRIKATLFQDKDFKDNTNNLIPYQYDFMDKSTNLLPNILIDNIYITLGYDLSAQGDNFASLYTFDSMSYNPSLSEKDNEKTIHLRWLREGQIMKPDMTDELEIRWYRFKLGKPSPDDLAGVNWERIETKTDKEYSLNFNPDIAKEQELVKVITLYGTKPGYYPYKSVTKDEFDWNKTDYYIRNGDNYIRCKEDDEHDSNIVYYYKQDETRQTYFTQPITFDNEVAIPNQATMDGLRGLTLIHRNYQDGKLTSSQGNFLLYNQANSLQDKSQGDITRIVGCALEIGGIPQDLNELTSVSWKFPVKNTMIKPIGDYTNLYKQVIIEEKDFGGLTEYYKLVDGEYILADAYVDGETYYILDDYAVQIWQGGSKELTEMFATFGSPVFKYTISQRLSYSNLNNIIECRVVYNGVEYVSSTSLTFGRIGSSGTDATFVLDLDNVNAITVGKDEWVSVSARLYDSNNESVDISSGYDITWDWFKKPFIYDSNDKASLILEGKGPNCKISHAITEPILLNINEVYILQATITGWGNYPLTAYLPIPLRAADNYINITGADSVVYLSDGTPQYYKETYEMHKDNGKGNGIWQIHYQSPGSYEYIEVENPVKILFDQGLYYIQDENGNYTVATEWYDLGLQYYVYGLSLDETDAIVGGYWPTLKNNCLAPSLIYSDGIETVPAVQYKEDGEVKWTQPILIIQNRYPSEMINQWDGKTIELNKDEGSILASAIGAGRKNKDNTFSGVILGDWADKADGSIGSKTGLYGYRNGALSFGFKDDGTAFIGTKSKGQLQFDGNESTISSASYRTAGGSGMILDFDEPYIKMRKYPGQKVISTKGKEEETYRSVGFVKTKEEWDKVFANSIPEGTGYYITIDEFNNDIYNATEWDPNLDPNTVYYIKEVTVIGGNGKEPQVTIYITDREQFNNLIKEATLYEFREYNGENYFCSIDYWSDDLIGKMVYIDEEIDTEKVLNAGQLTDKDTFYNLLKKYYHFDVKEDKNGNQSYYLVDQWDESLKNKSLYYVEKKSINYSIELGASENTPLRIGDNFKVGWDGTLYASNGDFTGKINATSGTISGTLRVTGTLKGGLISGSTIDGGTVNADNLIVEDKGTLKGNFTVRNLSFTHAKKEIKANTLDCGRLGYDLANPTNADDLEAKDIVAVGLLSANGRNTIKVSNYNIGLKYGGDDGKTYISLQDNGIMIATDGQLRLNGKINSLNVVEKSTLSTLEAGATTLTGTLDVSGGATLTSGFLSKSQSIFEKNVVFRDGDGSSGGTTKISGGAVETNSFTVNYMGSRKDANGNYGTLSFVRNVDFSEATVTGIYATLA